MKKTLMAGGVNSPLAIALALRDIAPFGRSVVYAGDVMSSCSAALEKHKVFIIFKEIINMAEKMFNQKTSYSLAILSGILLLLSFPPFNLGSVLAWVALVPLLIAIYYEKSLKRVGRLAIVSCLIVFVPILICLTQSEFTFLLPASLYLITWLIGIGLSILLALLYSDFPRVYWKPKEFPTIKLQYLPSLLQIFILPIVWTSFQFLIMNIPIVMKGLGGFGFFSIAKTQWLNPPILQLSSFTGMYGVTFLILLVNSAIAYGIIHYKETKRVSKQAIAVLLIFGVIFVSGLGSIPELAAGETNVVIIQANPSMMEREQISELYFNLTKNSLKYNPEIIFWSEWTIYQPFEQVGTPADWYVNFSKEHNVYLMDGALLSPDESIQSRNGAYHYFKTFDGVIPLNLNKIFPEIYPYEAKFGKIGFLLCQEGAWPFPARNIVKNKADMIATTTGNYGFAVPELFGGNAIYRAVENRVPAVLFLWSGAGSIIIDPYGRVIDDVAPEPEIVAGKISFADGNTFYTKYGDVFGWATVLLFVALWGYNFYLKRKNPFKYCIHCNAKLKKDVKTCNQCGKKADRGVLRTLGNIIPP